jgi:hypothetical protein
VSGKETPDPQRVLAFCGTREGHGEHSFVAYRRPESRFLCPGWPIPGRPFVQPIPYVAKPLAVEAIQVDGSIETARGIEEWTGGEWYPDKPWKDNYYGSMDHRDHGPNIWQGWWIVRSADGTFRAMEDDQFTATYDRQTEGGEP